MAINCFADEVNESYQIDLEQAECLLADRARQNQKLTPADYAFLTRCGWNEANARREFNRVTQALNQAAIAGSPEDRAAALLEAETAAKLLESEGPKIREKLDKLQKQLDGLERDQRLSQKRCEQQAEAVLKCQDLAPQYLVRYVDQKRTSLLTEGSGAKLRDAEARRHELVCILNHGGVYARLETHIDGLRRLLPEAVSQSVSGRMIAHRFSDRWPSLKSEHEREFAELNQRLPDLQAAFDGELSEIESPLNFYSNGQGDV